VLNFGVPRAYDDRDIRVGAALINADILGELLPIHRRHFDVADDQVGGNFPQRLEAVSAIRGEAHIGGLAIECHEHLPQEPPHEFIVIDD
jgi:hypothetical protein